MLRINYLFVLLFLSFNGYSQAQIPEVISQINLVQYVQKDVHVSDLFYAEQYDVNFLNSNKLSVVYDSTTHMVSLYSDSFTGFTTVEFLKDGQKYSIPVRVNPVTKRLFTYSAGKGNEVFLFGTFNSWNRSQYPMQYISDYERYEITIPLDYGRHLYKFMVNGEEVVDPTNHNRVPNGFGSENCVLDIQAPAGKLYLHFKEYVESSEFLAIHFFIESSGNPVNKGEYKIYAFLNNSLLTEHNIVSERNSVSIDIPIHKIKTGDMLRVTVSGDNRVSNTQTIPLWMLPGIEREFTWYDASIYSIMIDRFNDGNNGNNHPVEHDSLQLKASYMGGDIAGVTRKISDGYFDSLGINTLWISPVYDNPDEAFKEYPAPHRWFSGYHGYWPISSNKLESRFGSMNELKEMISLAHDHNIKVLLDYVSNHVHMDHPYYREHPDWFGNLELPDGRLNLRFWDEFRLTTWFEPYLPSFDYVGSSEALKTMTDNAVWWLMETGADGFRHDAVKHVPNEFWRLLTSKINYSLNTERELEVYQIGETFGSYELVSSYVNKGQLDAQFNFNLYDTAINTFSDSSSSFESLNDELQKTFSVYGILNTMGNVMDSHDKVRFMALADGDIPPGEDAVEIGWNNPPVVDHPNSYKKAELYYAYLFTIPGVPVVYYGSEFGMTGASDPDNRRMMRFTEDLSDLEKNMLFDVRKISNIRENNSSLKYGDFYPLKVDKNIFAYIRSDMNERVLVVLNKSEDIMSVSLNIPEQYGIDQGIDLINNEIYKIATNSIEINIPEIGYKIIRLSNND